MESGSQGLALGILFVGAFFSLGSANTLTEPQFIRSPGNVTSSLGKPVKVVCTLQGWGGEDPPDVVWQRDGQPLEYADTNQIQVPVASRSWMVISTLRIEKVQLPDMGSYRCAVMSEGHQTLSVAGHIHLEGLPHFSVEPQHQSVVANVSLSLHCVAHGPPEPVRVIWLQDGAPLNSLQDHVALSPSTVNITGLNRTSTFSCEAHNRKGVATSGSGTITVLPSQPQRVRAVDVTNSSLLLSWEPGFGGVYPITHCTIQVKRSGEDVGVGGGSHDPQPECEHPTRQPPDRGSGAE
ncbi:tyrosine-protein kinase receptor UFO-like [Oncorhynchus tshawytscha]|uniref:tyrosine-protein kinase receptor UFO-like n=1 Tax=Oncorhynchus tshawytscha TaxID=74940 RepID=UPI001C3D18C0|nr:tyrosine-protein kinase receptor UFO-like [Oncorhynchus tshawytscha]